MSNADLIPYLKKYIADPRIVTIADIGADRKNLPSKWLELLSLEGKNRIQSTIALWKSFGDKLSEVTEKLASGLVSLDLLKSGDQYSLLYGIKTESRVLYYQAKNPLFRHLNSNIGQLWPSVPADIREFYSIHDGWYYLASHSMGLFPCDELFVLSDEEWTALESIDAPVDIDKSIAFFTNGMTGYVCLEIKTSAPENAAFLWWSDKQPKTGLKFWDIIDSWTAMGIKE